jgi:hydroxyethylthiazole kinase
MRIGSETLCERLEQVREAAPLVHHITNYVTANDCANATLAIGASPVMADDPAEAAEMAGIASALVVNIGTLNARTVESMIASGRAACERRIPIIFDPVGVGATAFRNETAARLMRDIRPSVIRGNASEVLRLGGADIRTKGVDAGVSGIRDLAGTVSAIRHLRSSGVICAVTGATDIIADGCDVVTIENGHPAMSKITGTGCMCTSLVASFCGAGVPPFEAAVCGVAVMGIAGELAFERSGARGVGSMRVSLIDEIGKMSPDTLKRRLKMRCENR